MSEPLQLSPLAIPQSQGLERWIGVAIIGEG